RLLIHERAGFLSCHCPKRVYRRCLCRRAISSSAQQTTVSWATSATNYEATTNLSTQNWVTNLGGAISNGTNYFM
ncbi:MAG TPA: hypothetical protein VLT36_23150, partial [Candidatus Dormibacteraeota bacterium]|nr:hypothetical protein [Candidatus Dormibacteraeota bacterium]